MSSLYRVSLLLSAIALLAPGCATSKSSNTARTATEQMLITNAVDQSLNKIDFRPFRGHSVYLNDKYVDCVDKSYVISSVRHRILTAGATLVDDPKEADVLMELRTGVVGTDTAESFVGVPEITLPGMLTLPEVRLLTRSIQKGTAKLGLVATDARTKQILGTGGVSLAQSDTQNWFVMGVGPFRYGSIDHEVQQSTIGPAARIRNWMPTTVAFQSPSDVAATGQRYAASEDTDTTPVSFEEPAEQTPHVEVPPPKPPRRLDDE